ncbi:hypothetical protein OAL29_00880 [Candidatus Binatia bacterium]|nr:hypothetical protein [Candidatus Binatia bacterium]
MNYYLKTEDEQNLWEALESKDLAVRDYDPDDALNSPPNDWDFELNGEYIKSGAYEWRFVGQALDIIGTIYTPTGNTLTDDEGMEYPEMTAVDGFHANMKADAGIEGLPTIDAPATPYRKWAGE